MIKLEYKVLRFVGTLSRAINSTSDSNYKRFGLQKGQYMFITRVCENPGINFIELSDMLKVDKATTTKAVKEQDENDKRGYKLNPTPKALVIYEKIMAEESKQLEISFKGFSEEEKKIATDLIEKMSENIEEYWLKVKNKKSREKNENSSK